MPEDVLHEADQLIAALGSDAVTYLVERIKAAVAQDDDRTVSVLDARLRAVERRLHHR